MTYRLFTLLAALALVGVDQGLKIWAATALQPVGQMPLIPNVIGLRFLLNDGAAFGMLSGKQTFLQIITGVALAALLVYLLKKKPETKLEYAAYLLIFSGGVGNMIDRVLNGVVVDYIELLFMDFAIFNFADILVCVGVGLLFVALLMPEFKKLGKDRDAEV